MTTDTIVDGIHKFREAYAKRFENDLKAICNNARKKQGQDGRKVIRANPNPAKTMRPDTEKSA
jgi:hypothetical protein